MSYRIEFISSAARQIQKLPKPEQKRILGAIERLANDPRPRGCTKLRGREAWRVRTGDYRIIYEISDHQLLITVIRAGHRRDVYDSCG